MQPFSQRLTEWSNEFDRIFNHLLGYVIAFTSLVAFADVLGNGAVLQFSPVLFWIWVFAQGLCVEFQVFILIKRMPGYWNSNRVMFGVYACFIASLCLMSILIGSVFVQHDQEHRTVEGAMSSLGIPHIGFIYARAALAILLVALIAIDRAIEQHQMQSVQDVHALPQPEDAPVRLLAIQLKEVASNQTQLTEVVVHITQMVKDLQSRVEQQMYARVQLEEGRTPQELEERHCAVRPDTDAVQSLSTEERIRAYLTEVPNASVRTVATAVGCSATTANKWISRVREEQGHPQLRAVK